MKTHLTVISFLEALEFNILRHGFSLAPGFQNLKNSFDFGMRSFSVALEIQNLKTSFDFGIQYFLVLVFGGSRATEPKNSFDFGI